MERRAWWLGTLVLTACGGGAPPGPTAPAAGAAADVVPAGPGPTLSTVRGPAPEPLGLSAQDLDWLPHEARRLPTADAAIATFVVDDAPEAAVAEGVRDTLRRARPPAWQVSDERTSDEAYAAVLTPIEPRPDGRPLAIEIAPHVVARSDGGPPARATQIVVTRAIAAAVAPRVAVAMPGPCVAPEPPAPPRGVALGARSTTELDLDGDGAFDALVSATGTCDPSRVCQHQVFVMRGGCGHALGVLEASRVFALETSHGGLLDLVAQLTLPDLTLELRHEFVVDHYEIVEQRECTHGACPPWVAP
ncbi:MAG: hypothetical protein R2939_10440 [Kofleriaceae bacterium]